MADWGDILGSGGWMLDRLDRTGVMTTGESVYIGKGDVESFRSISDSGRISFGTSKRGFVGCVIGEAPPGL
jgi:hypothetical protein